MKHLVVPLCLFALAACDSDQSNLSAINDGHSQDTASIDVAAVLTTPPSSAGLRRLPQVASDGTGIELLRNGNFDNTSQWLTCDPGQPIGSTSVGLISGTAVMRENSCVQQGVDLTEIPSGTRLELTCDVAISDASLLSSNWTGVGITYFDSSLDFISEPAAALVNSVDFRSYNVTSDVPEGAAFAGVWVYTQRGASVSACSLKRPDDGPVQPNFDNVLINAEFADVSGGNINGWINYCRGSAGATSQQSAEISGGACLTQSLDNQQLAALRGNDFLLQCRIENPGSGYASLITNVSGTQQTQRIQAAPGARLVTITGTVPASLGNAYVGLYKEGGGTLTLYQCQLRRTATPLANQPPVANDDLRVFPAITRNNFSSFDLRVIDNDLDPEGALDYRITITQPPSNGTLYGLPFATDYFTTVGVNDSFRYTISDRQGLVSNEATVTIQFEPAAGN